MGAQGLQRGVVCERGSYPPRLPAFLSPPHTPYFCLDVCPASAGQQQQGGAWEQKPQKPGAVPAGLVLGNRPLPVQGRRLGAPREPAGTYEQDLSPKHHRTMRLGLQAPCTIQTCRLSGPAIHVAPTNKGLPILPFLHLPSLFWASMRVCRREWVVLAIFPGRGPWGSFRTTFLELFFLPSLSS